MVRVKSTTTPTAVPFEWDIFGWIWSLFQTIFSIDYLAPFEALFILLCYAYLIYYTGLNLLSRSKYYINLSHNLIKWIFLGVVSCSGILFDKLFKFNLLSRITIMALTGLIVYPSRRMQRLHLSLAIRNKDKIYEKRRDDPIASGLSIFQKFLNSITGMFLSLANLTLKLIHPDNRTPDVQMQVTNLYETIKRKRYFLELAESQVMQDINIDIPGVTVNMTTSGVLVREPFREQTKTPDYGLLFDSPLKTQTAIQPQLSFVNLGGKLFDCAEVIQITKKKYEYFRDIQIRYLSESNEVEIAHSNRSEVNELIEVRVMNDQTLELILTQKSRFIQFKSATQMQSFMKPIIQESKDQS